MAEIRRSKVVGRYEDKSESRHGSKQPDERNSEAEQDATAARNLRRQAEALAKETLDPRQASLMIGEAGSIFHELRVHQIELEIQNEELRRAQTALDESRAQYFKLYDLAPVGYVTVSKAGLILQANLRAATMLGRGRSELVSQPLTRFISDRDQDTYYLQRKKVLSTGFPTTFELRMKHANGSTPWMRLEATTAPNEGDSGPTIWTTISDITDQRMLQDRLARTERMASMGLLAAGIGHEINNPLTYVLHNLEILAEDLPRLNAATGRLALAVQQQIGIDALARIAGEDTRFFALGGLSDLTGLVDEAIEGTRRIVEISRGLNTFSHMEKAALTLVDLNLAGQQAIKMTNQEIECRAVLHQDFGQIPLVMATQSKLTQVFVNLIVNATQAIAEGSVSDNRLTLRTWADDRHVFAEVADTGSGISPEKLKNIFEPFYTTKGSHRGTGLGLAITRGIIDELGGDIEVDSTPGQGTRVLFSLPVPRTPEASSAVPPTLSARTRAKILVVDDEEDILRVTKRILNREHDVVTAISGRAAQEILAKDSTFDYILCDVMMIDVSGIELHAWLVKHHPRLARRFAFVSGGVFTPKASEYLANVTNPHIEKPFSGAGLIQQVNELLLAAQADN